MPVITNSPFFIPPSEWTAFTEVQGFRNTGQSDSREHFGYSMSITSDGNRVLIGMPDANNGIAGSAFTFTRSGDTWTQEDEMQASDSGGANDRFGRAVSISNDGTKAIIGARAAGKAYYFTRSGSVWTEQQIITGSSASAFGWSCAISGDGNYMVIGEPFDDVGGSNAGRVHVYALVTGSWVFRQTKYVSGDGNNTNFGWSCSMSDNGFRFAAGYQNDPANSQKGGVGVFHGNGTTWSENTKLDGGYPHNKYGYDIHMTGDGLNLIFGAILNDVHAGLQDVGAALIYEYSGSWSLVQQIRAGDPQEDDYFGNSVYLSEDLTYALVGAPREDTGGSSKGSAYIFKLDGTYSQLSKIQSSTATSNFGFAVVLTDDGSSALISSPPDAAPGGTVFYFKPSGS